MQILLHNQNLDLQVQIEQLQKVVHSSENALVVSYITFLFNLFFFSLYGVYVLLLIQASTFQEYSEKYEAEKFELLSQIRSLQKEISSLTSSSLAREKESLRKDLEKTKAKLKDTESKLKNAIQEKTKLEV